MSEIVIVDTGPLVAHYCEDDQHHEWARWEMGKLPAPLVTCEAVITESSFLLARNGVEPTRMVRAVKSGFLKIGIEISREAAEVEGLMNRYADTPMSLADACLVRLTELHQSCRVFTLDQDFVHYRRHGRKVIPLLSPW